MTPTKYFEDNYQPSYIDLGSFEVEEDGWLSGFSQPTDWIELLMINEQGILTQG